MPVAKRSYYALSFKVQETVTGGQLKDVIREKIEEMGIENIYKVSINGYRDPEIHFDFTGMDYYGNVLEFRDESVPSYDYEALFKENRRTLLGAFLESFRGQDLDEVELQARAEGVRALLETRKK